MLVLHVVQVGRGGRRGRKAVPLVAHRSVAFLPGQISHPCHHSPNFSANIRVARVTPLMVLRVLVASTVL
jgi:hypothetical protein